MAKLPGNGNDPSSTALVPFGRYKGQPVEVMAADTDYLDWCKAQPGLMEKYGGLWQKIVVVQYGAQESQETPDHNRLQALFLEDDFCTAMIVALDISMPDPQELIASYRNRFKNDVAILEKEHAELYQRQEEWLAKAEEKLSSPIGAWSGMHTMQGSREENYRYLDPSDQRVIARNEKYLREEPPKRANDVAECKEAIASLSYKYRAILSAIDKNVKDKKRGFFVCYEPDVEFEDGGVDVKLTAEVSAYGISVTQSSSYSGWSSLGDWTVIQCGETERLVRLSIECKPTVGDDYPAILRQMNANGSSILLLRDFNSEVLSLSGLKKFFKKSRKTVITLEEVQAQLSNLPVLDGHWQGQG